MLVVVSVLLCPISSDATRSWVGKRVEVELVDHLHTDAGVVEVRIVARLSPDMHNFKSVSVTTNAGTARLPEAAFAGIVDPDLRTLIVVFSKPYSGRLYLSFRHGPPRAEHAALYAANGMEDTRAETSFEITGNRYTSRQIEQPDTSIVIEGFDKAHFPEVKQ
jgi:hypothetical protein